MGKKHSGQQVLLLRVLVAFGFLSAVVVCVAGSFIVLRTQEDRLFESQYSSIAAQATKTAVFDMNRKIRSGKIAAAILSESFPNESDWPNVFLSGYVRLANLLISLENDRGLGFDPIVFPEDVESFENFAREQYEKSGYPPSTGNNSFGFGIWGADPNTPDNRYHDTSGETDYNSSNLILTPFFQAAHVATYFPFLLHNNHNEVHRGTTIDRVIKCTIEHPEKVLNNSCGSTTPPLTWSGLNDEPTTIYYHPITIANNSGNHSVDTGPTVGVTLIGARWSDVLRSVVPNFVQGVDIVVETTSHTSTYTIQQGSEPIYSYGDVHDPSFSSYRKTETVYEDGVLSPGSTPTILHFYPRSEFAHQYHTHTPLIASVFVGLVIVLVGVVFLLYDHAVKLEFNEKQATLDVKRQFVKYISHEMRTPMNTVCLGLTLLQGELKAEIDKEVKEVNAGVIPCSDFSRKKEALNDWMQLVKDVAENAESAVAVLSDLLNYDRIEMGTMELDASPLEIGQLVEKTVHTFNLQARQVGVDLSVNLDKWKQSLETCKTYCGDACSTMRVVGDGVKLTQVLRNLVSNALKFTHEGGQVVVEADWKKTELGCLVRSMSMLSSSSGERGVTSHRKAGTFILTVTDSGAGLSKDQLTRMFAEGAQFNVNELQAGQGSGLGLCIAKGIVEQHGGRLSVSSPGLGKGACFTMEIPVVHSECASLSTKPAAEVTPRKLSKSRVHPTTDVILDDVVGDDVLNYVPQAMVPHEHKVLVADDTTLNRKLLCRLLTLQGHECHEVKNGQEAVDMFTSCDSLFPFHTILMDSEMPVMNGPDATKKLRENGCTCLIVGVTGNVLPEDIEYFKAMGANAVIPKPFSLSALQQLWQEAYV